MVARIDDETPLLYSDSGRYQRNESNCYIDSGHEIPVENKDTLHAYKRRWRSVRVMYIFTFFSATSFTITLPSLWTYLKVLNPQADASFLGWAVSAYGLGQIVSSPLFGGWANCRRSTREPMLVCSTLSCVAYVLYIYLDNLPDHKDYFLIANRALIGFSSGFTGVLRSYISAATTLEERTLTMTNLSIYGSIGFIVGPLLQSALVLVSYPGPLESSAFHFNMYTAPSFFAAIASFINMVLIVFVFEEHNINDEEDDEEKSIQSSSESRNFVKVDHVAVFSCILLFFTVAFTFQTVQTIGERALLLFGFITCFLAYFMYLPWGNQLPPLSMTPLSDATTLNPTPGTSVGYMTTTRSVNDIIRTFTASFGRHFQPSFGGKDFKTVSETLPTSLPTSSQDHTPSDSDLAQRKMSVIPYAPKHMHSQTSIFNGTLVNSLFGLTRVIYHPEFNASAETSVNNLSTTVSPNHNSTDETLGCPREYEWCSHVPAVQLVQYIVGTVLIAVGFPICQVLAFSIYSKVLGPNPQGLWMGYFTAAGSAAGVLGPIFITNIYGWYGPRVAFGSCCAVLATIILFLLIVYQRLIPFSQRQSQA